MRTMLPFAVLCCLHCGHGATGQDFFAAVKDIESELVELQQTGFQASRVHEICQGLKDLGKWPGKSMETGPLTRSVFLATLTAQAKDPTHESASRILYATMTTLWVDIPHVDAEESAVMTERFLETVAIAYMAVRSALENIPKPDHPPQAPYPPASYLGQYFSGPPPRPEDIVNETDRAAYEPE